MNLAPAIANLPQTTLAFTRYAAQTADANGLAQSPTPASTFDAEGSFQPLNGAELRALPEGRRTSEVRKFYTATLLRNKDVADDGTDTWEVFDVQDWSTAGFYLALLSKEVN